MRKLDWSDPEVSPARFPITWVSNNRWTRAWPVDLHSSDCSLCREVPDWSVEHPLQCHPLLCQSAGWPCPIPWAWGHQRAGRCAGGHPPWHGDQSAQVQPAPHQHGQVPGRAVQLPHGGIHCHLQDSLLLYHLWHYSRWYVCQPSDHVFILPASDGFPDSSPSVLDPPECLFRVRLVCTLLDTCGQYFDRGSSKKKLDCFLTYFQVSSPRIFRLYTNTVNLDGPPAALLLVQEAEQCMDWCATLPYWTGLLDGWHHWAPSTQTYPVYQLCWGMRCSCWAWQAV